MNWILSLIIIASTSSVFGQAESILTMKQINETAKMTQKGELITVTVELDERTSRQIAAKQYLEEANRLNDEAYNMKPKKKAEYAKMLARKNKSEELKAKVSAISFNSLKVPRVQQSFQVDGGMLKPFLVDKINEGYSIVNVQRDTKKSRIKNIKKARFIGGVSALLTIGSIASLSANGRGLNSNRIHSRLDNSDRSNSPDKDTVKRTADIAIHKATRK